ncbi:MAG: hypothetical protein IK099_01735 [Clostridia bacterium]|nr:hypothetical protein [Clostridia bacterium]
MVKRFLLYSLHHDCPVKALFADTMQYRNIRVIAMEGDEVTFRLPGRKHPVTASVDAFLTVSYARGDDGDTLKYAVWDQGKKNMEQP